MPNKQLNDIFGAFAPEDYHTQHADNLYYRVLYKNKHRHVSRFMLYRFLELVWSIQLQLNKVGWGKTNALNIKFWCGKMKLNKTTYYMYMQMLEESLCLDPSAAFHNKKIRHPPDICISKIDYIHIVEEL